MSNLLALCLPFPWLDPIQLYKRTLSASEPNMTFAGKQAAALAKSEAVHPGTDPAVKPCKHSTASTTSPVYLCLGYSCTVRRKLLHTRALLVCPQALSKSGLKLPSPSHYPRHGQPSPAAHGREGAVTAAAAFPLTQYKSPKRYEHPLHVRIP